MQHQNRSFSHFCTVWYDVAYSQPGRERFDSCGNTASSLPFTCLLFSSSKHSHWTHCDIFSGEQVPSCPLNEDSQALYFPVRDFLEFQSKELSGSLSELCSSGHLQLLGFAPHCLMEEGGWLRNMVFHSCLAPNQDFFSSQSQIQVHFSERFVQLQIQTFDWPGCTRQR